MQACGPRAMFYLAAAVSDFYIPWCAHQPAKHGLLVCMPPTNLRQAPVEGATCPSIKSSQTPASAACRPPRAAFRCSCAPFPSCWVRRLTRTRCVAASLCCAPLTAHAVQAGCAASGRRVRTSSPSSWKQTRPCCSPRRRRRCSAMACTQWRVASLCSPHLRLSLTLKLTTPPCFCGRRWRTNCCRAPSAFPSSRPRTPTRLVPLCASRSCSGPSATRTLSGAWLRASRACTRRG
jgi:hypothetical protein